MARSITPNRLVTLGGKIEIKDDDAPNEYKDFFPHGYAVVRPGGGQALVTLTDTCVGGEVVFKLYVTAEEKGGGEIEYDVQCWLYEGTSCLTTDKEDYQRKTDRLAPGGTVTVRIKLENEEWLSTDYAKGTLRISNNDAVVVKTDRNKMKVKVPMTPSPPLTKSDRTKILKRLGIK